MFRRAAQGLFQLLQMRPANPSVDANLPLTKAFFNIFRRVLNPIRTILKNSSSSSTSTFGLSRIVSFKRAESTFGDG